MKNWFYYIIAFGLLYGIYGAAISSNAQAVSSEQIETERSSLISAVATFKQKCGHVPDNNQTLLSECAAEQSLLESRIDAYDALRFARVANSIEAVALRKGWSAEKRVRLDHELHDLDLDENFDHDDVLADRVWKDVQSRGANELLKREAANGRGTNLFDVSAGRQTNYNDCAVFALANASGRPYGFVVALATELISQESFHSLVDQQNPQNAIEKVGLNGGEVIMLAETMGQAQIIPPSEFAQTIQTGRPIMINVNNHEVVLSRTFKHNGETWYEMIDSHLDARGRRFLSDTEVKAIIVENGVSYKHDKGVTPQLLK